MVTLEEALWALKTLPGQTIWVPRVYERYTTEYITVNGLEYTRTEKRLYATAKQKTIVAVRIDRDHNDFISATLISNDEKNIMPQCYTYHNDYPMYETEGEALADAENLLELGEEYLG